VQYCTKCAKVVHKDHSTQTRNLCTPDCVQTRVYVGDKPQTLPRTFYCFLCNKDCVGKFENHHHYPIDNLHLVKHHLIPYTTSSSVLVQNVKLRQEHSCKVCEKHKVYASTNDNRLVIRNEHAPIYDKLTHIDARNESKNITNQILQTPKNQVCILTKAKSDVRYKIRKNQQISNAFYIESRGNEHDRILLAWRKSDVKNVLKDYLPADIVYHHIIPKLEILYSNDSLQKPEHRNARIMERKRLETDKRYTCSQCGNQTPKQNIGVSPYFNSMVCFDCINDDEELWSHKWESLNDIY
jgi:transcription elongation factor Elf1